MRNFDDYIENGLFLVGVERNIVERWDWDVILFDVDVVFEGVWGSNFVKVVLGSYGWRCLRWLWWFGWWRCEMVSDLKDLLGCGRWFCGRIVEEGRRGGGRMRRSWWRGWGCGFGFYGGSVSKFLYDCVGWVDVVNKVFVIGVCIRDCSGGSLVIIGDSNSVGICVIVFGGFYWIVFEVVVVVNNINSYGRVNFFVCVCFVVEFLFVIRIFKWGNVCGFCVIGL